MPLVTSGLPDKVIAFKLGTVEKPSKSLDALRRFDSSPAGFHRRWTKVQYTSLPILA